MKKFCGNGCLGIDSPGSKVDKSKRTSRGRKQESMMKSGWLQWLIAQLREFGPYFAVELILPGGTLIALALYALRRRHALWPGSGAAR